MSSAFIDVSSHPFRPIHEEEETVQELEQDMMRNCSISSTGSGHIDIHGQPVSSDILVALLDRDSEMKDLVARNYPFYETLQHYIEETQGQEAWTRFQDVLYKPRQKLPDRVWMNQITHYLAHNPVFLTKFKEIVGYEDEDPNITSTYRSNSTSSSSSNKRRSRRLSSNMSLVDILSDDESISYEDAPKIPEGMFSAEDPFHGRRRRSSYHSIQSEPHPTFVDIKIDEVDEANIDHHLSSDDESDHLADLLDDDDEDDTSVTDIKATKQSDMEDLIRLRDYPDLQYNLYKTHPSFFKKAKQLLSMAPSSRRFSATIRRNSILEDAMPPSPVTELDEPRMQTEEDSEEDHARHEGGHLAQLICCTRRQQPDDIAWLNSVLEALSGWPELIDRLHEIIQESLEDEYK